MSVRIRRSASPIRSWAAATGVSLGLLLAACEQQIPVSPEGPAGEFARLDGVTTANLYGDAFDEGLDRWREELPRIQEVRIPSSEDGHEQPALWQPPEGDEPRPLLVVLHTWSTEYLQHIGIPFGHWADAMNWAMIHPNFRGANDNPDATGSELAVQDVLDAVDYATANAGIAEDKVYVIGFSGGGYKALLMAGRHPDRFAAAAAWVPIHDLTEWYRHHTEIDPSASYIEHIEQSCEGSPTADDQARERCDQRSPSSHLDGAQAAGIPIYIGHGLSDEVVPPSHAGRAFNQLAREDDRLDESQIEALGENRLPEELQGEIGAETYFTDADPEVLFARASGPVTLVLFEGDHDMVYHPGLEWMIEQTF